MTTRVVVGNLATAVGGPGPQRIQQVLGAIEEQFDPDVWLLCETNRVRPARLLGKGSWAAHQGSRILGRRNNAVVWDRNLTATRKRFWIGTFPQGHVLEPRWINRARVTGIGWTVVHIPPLRDQELVPGMLRNMSRHTYAQRLTWGGDRNQADMRAWAEHHGYHYREQEVMFLASDLPILRFRHVTFAGFDHPFLIGDIGHE